MAVFAFLSPIVPMACSLPSTGCSDVVIIAGAMALVDIWVVALVGRYLLNVRPNHVAGVDLTDSLVVDDDSDTRAPATLSSARPAHSSACSPAHSNIMHHYFPFFAASCLSC